jgi:hypothetical protein
MKNRTKLASLAAVTFAVLFGVTHGDAYAVVRGAAVRVGVRPVIRAPIVRGAAAVNYINRLPYACPYAGAYYNCGGVYYQPVMQGGTTVYVIVQN